MIPEAINFESGGHGPPGSIRLSKVGSLQMKPCAGRVRRRELPPPLPDDAGLRTVLRNVPLLPAPANVDDLVARLDAEEVPVSSGPLAELISDARYIEPASNATHSDEANDRFFAPVSRAVNTNRRPPLAPRLSSGLFNAALLAGALLILWNALLAPDGAPPPVTPMKTAESATASDLTKAPALTVAAAEPTPETRTDNAMFPEAPASPVKPLEPYRPLASMDAVVLPEPELEPVPTTPDPVVEAEAHQARGMLLAVDRAPQSEPAPIGPVPAPDVDLAQPHGTIVSPSPSAKRSLNPVQHTCRWNQPSPCPQRQSRPARRNQARRARRSYSHRRQSLPRCRRQSRSVRRKRKP